MEKLRPLQELGVDINGGVIPLLGDIDTSMYGRLVMCLTTMSNLGIEYDEITILLNTPGGEVDQAFAIYDLLRNLESTIRVVCNGPVASAGNIILMAGDKREMNKHSYLMFHYGTDGNECDNDRKHNEARNRKEWDIFEAHTKVPKSEIELWSNTNVYYFAEQALALGIITGIHDNDTRAKRKKKRATRTRK